MSQAALSVQAGQPPLHEHAAHFARQKRAVGEEHKFELLRVGDNPPANVVKDLDTETYTRASKDFRPSQRAGKVSKLILKADPTTTDKVQMDSRGTRSLQMASLVLQEQAWPVLKCLLPVPVPCQERDGPCSGSASSLHGLQSKCARTQYHNILFHKHPTIVQAYHDHQGF